MVERGDSECWVQSPRVSAFMVTPGFMLVD